MKIFLIGFMGSGKSYWGHKLAGALNIPLIELDEEIVKAAERSIPEIFAQKGESYFRQLEHDKLHASLHYNSFVLSCGGGVPCFFDNMSVMKENGLTVWLNAPVPAMVDRLMPHKYKRPLIKDFDDKQLYAYVEMKLAERRGFYEQAHLTIDPTEETIESFTEKIKLCINPT